MIRMKNKFLCALVSLFAVAVSCNANGNTSASASIGNAVTSKSVYDFTMKDIDGNTVPLANYKGKIIVIVNTASKCGLAPQLKEIEAFYQKYKDKGVVVLGFPEANFLDQELHDDAQIKAVCTKNFGVTFPLFSRISVKGDDIAPLYKYLTSKDENGVVDAPIKWNYQKFIINKEGKVVASIPPRTTVNDQEFMQNIEDLLK